MVSNQHFIVRLTLASSVIIGRRLTLDAVMAALLFERDGDIVRAHEDLPLVRETGVWHASQAFLEGPAPATLISQVQSMPAHRVEGDEFSSASGGRVRLDPAKGRYRNRLTRYLSYDAPAAWFVGYGDLEAAHQLMTTAHSLGARRNQGFGQVSRVEVAPVALRRTRPAWILADGTPARPVPAELWREIGGAGDVDWGYETFTPPYWSGEQALCALPARRGYPRAELERVLIT